MGSREQALAQCSPHLHGSVCSEVVMWSARSDLAFWAEPVEFDDFQMIQ